MAQMIKDILQIILQLANIVIIGYGLYKFLNKPHDTLEQRHNALEKRVDEHDMKFKEIDESLHEGNDNFREQKRTNATFKSVMLSFVNFEIAFCIHNGYEHTEDLINAKTELENYLAGK